MVDEKPALIRIGAKFFRHEDYILELHGQYLTYLETCVQPNASIRAVFRAVRGSKRAEVQQHVVKRTLKALLESDMAVDPQSGTLIAVFPKPS